MPSGLEAIRSELRRLQRDGVSRVFVEDDTMQLIAPKAGRSPVQASAQPGKTETETGDIDDSAVRRSTQHTDLRQLIRETPETKTEAPAQAKAGEKAASLPDPPEIELPQTDADGQLAWLRDRVLNCEVSREHLADGSKIVFGTGSPQADIFFFGEAPGREEETSGQPFVGKAGELLAKIITAMGLQQEEVFMDYILRWRPGHDKPHGNRPPTYEEMRYCLPYLKAQINIIKPKVIVALGNTALTGLVGPDSNRKMASVRGTWTYFDDIPIMTTFPPDYLLRNGTLKTKRMAWEDMLKVMEKCSLEISEKQRGFFLPKS